MSNKNIILRLLHVTYFVETVTQRAAESTHVCCGMGCQPSNRYKTELTKDNYILQRRHPLLQRDKLLKIILRYGPLKKSSITKTWRVLCLESGLQSNRWFLCNAEKRLQNTAVKTEQCTFRGWGDVTEPVWPSGKALGW